MIFSKNYDDINSVYDFSEGIISDVRWENNTNLLIDVYYFSDKPIGFKDKDITVRFKNCFSANFDYEKMMNSVQEFNIVNPHPEIEAFTIIKNNSRINVTVTTNFSDTIKISCESICIESKDC